MRNDISEISSSIQIEAAKVLVLRRQCKALSERALRACCNANCDDEVFISILEEVLSFLIHLQSEIDIFEDWLTNDSRFTELNGKLDPYDSDNVSFYQSDISSDETEMSSFVTNSIQKYSTLQSNESRILNKEMRDNLNFIRNYKDGDSSSIPLREYDNDSLKIGIGKNNFLGVGGFGTVRKGVFRGIEVAVKQVVADIDDDNYDLHCYELSKEARILQLHSFPGVIRFFGVDNADRPTKMAMELAVCSLHSVLHSRKNKMDLSENRKVELLHSMCSTLSFLHSVGIVHRDIKSENFLMMSDGSVKVADFGLSKANFAEKTVGHILKGTYSYLAPELLMKSYPPYVYTEATDMYSFGVLMNEVMTNEIPFNDIPEIFKVAKMIESGGLLRPAVYSGILGRKLEPLISKCWDETSSKRGDFFQLCFLLRRCMPRPATISDNLEVINVNDEFLASDVAGYYTGQMKGYSKHGDGVLRCLNGIVYEGSWKNNQLHGFGIRNGPEFCYEGNYVNFSREGYGVMKYADGNVYSGEWKNSAFEGNGRMKFADDREYNGEWKNGVRDGHGVMKYPDGRVYDGNWKNGVQEGYGVLYGNGDEYDGTWKNGVREGHGVMVYADGSVYRGLWSNGVHEGHGVMKLKNGEVYDGDWKNGTPEGHGELRLAHGEVFDGYFKNGVREGHGVMTYANGDVYDGDWKNDRKEGRGVMVYTDGTFYYGTWNKSIRVGRGVMNFADGGV